jgi:Fic family protein
VTINIAIDRYVKYLALLAIPTRIGQNHGMDDFEPLFPEDRVLGPLRERAHAVQREAWNLAGVAHPSVLRALSPLLRAMNSYYTNRIEGQQTLPADIEKAIRKDFSPDPDRAAKQRLAVAHMRTEAWAEEAYRGRAPQSLFAPSVVLALHEHLYGQLSQGDLETLDRVAIEPGRLRTRGVTVGAHVAPPPESLPALLDRFAARYGALPAGESLLIGVACAHQRLAWIHPFADGNGRAARLHSHVILDGMQLTAGLWSPMRGLARHRDEYYERLHNADLPRRNDLDGRGPLSQEHLVEFSDFFLTTCLDQVSFMHRMLRLDAMRPRLDALLTFEKAHGHEYLSPAAGDALHYAFLSGPLERSRFIALLGIPERSGRRILTALLDYGLLTSDSPKGAVHFAVPFRALRFLFPALWPEAEAGA